MRDSKRYMKPGGDPTEPLAERFLADRDGDEIDPRMLRPIKPKEREQFLLLISEGFSVARAARALVKSRGAFQKLIDEDGEFRERFEAAYEASADQLEDEAWRRAHERGRHMLGSDRLLEMSLKARRPWRYGDRVQVSGPNGGPVRQVVAHVDHAAVLEVLAEAGVIQPGRLVALDGGGEDAS